MALPAGEVKGLVPESVGLAGGDWPGGLSGRLTPPACTVPPLPGLRLLAGQVLVRLLDGGDWYLGLPS